MCTYIYTYLYSAYTLSCMYGTGWRRLIGRYLELQVIFRKIATNYRALLRKTTCEEKASYDTTPPCIRLVFFSASLYFFAHRSIFSVLQYGIGAYLCI